MREVNYHNPIDYLESNIYILFDVVKNSQLINSNEDHLTIGFLFLSMHKDGLLKQEDLKDRNRFEQFRQDLIFKSDVDDTQITYKQIFAVLEEKLSKLENSILQQISLKLFGINEINREMLSQNFSKVFDNILYRYAKADGRHFGEFIQPLELNRFMCGLADLKEDAKIFNPFAGLASFGIYLNPKQVYVGQEFNQRTWALGALRIMAFERTAQSKYNCVDSVLNWPDSSEKFDLIISNPPFRMRLENQLSEIEPNIKTVDQLIILKGLQSLKQNGKLVMLLHESFLYSSAQHEYSLRKFLVDEDLIDTIISLPGGILTHTGIASVILLINKNKDRPEKIRLIDAKSFVDDKDKRKKILNDQELLKFIHGYENNLISDNQSFVHEQAAEYHPLNNSNKNELNIKKRMVDKSQIKVSDFNLNIPLYFQNAYEGVCLRELGTFVKGSRVNEHQIGKFVRIRNLKEDAFDFGLDLNNLEDTPIPKFAQCISESCLLFASKWKTLKPTYFSYTDTPIYITSDIFAFKIDESKCDRHFLINELLSAYVSEQLNSYRTGAVIPFIKKDDLLSVIISVPGIDEQGVAKQRSIAKQKLLELGEEKKRELILFNKIHGLENDIIEQNTYLRHTLAGPSSNLKESILNLKNILLEKVVPHYPQLLNLKLSDKHQLTLNEYLNIIERDSNKIVTAVSSQLKVDNNLEAKELYPVEIIEFLFNYTNEYNNRDSLNFSIEFDIDETVFKDEEGNLIKTFILANNELLYSLFDNLIDNAVKHAFFDENNNRFEFFLMKRTDLKNKDEIQILFSNTGRPFPEDFMLNDFIRKGAKFGLNAGDGFGGWYINEIIKKFNGNFDIIDEHGIEGLPGTDLATSFEINFPIFDTEENA